eukprot:scaffold156825_cov30-Tisochrysis_lutea.AAC.3
MVARSVRTHRVVMPDAMASSMICGQIQCTWVSIAPAVTMSFSPAIESVVTPVIIPGVTPSMQSGLPALPMPTMREPFGGDSGGAQVRDRHRAPEPWLWHRDEGLAAHAHL